jgi:hypothetical protein
MNRFFLLLCGLLLSATTVANEKCEISLLHDFRVSSEFLQVSSDGIPRYEILQGGDLQVNGADVALNAEQRVLAEAYAGEVGAMAAQWIELVSTALDVIGASLETALTEAFGADSPAVAKAGQAVARARQKFEDIAMVENGVYSLTVQEYNDFGETLSEEIEIAVEASAGSFLSELGNAIQDQEVSLEDRMAAFGQRMKFMGAELQRMGESLADTGVELCTQARELQKLEHTVSKNIPELADYPLFGM